MKNTKAAKKTRERLEKNPATALGLYANDAEEGITDRDGAGRAIARNIFNAVKRDSHRAGSLVAESAQNYEDYGATDTVSLGRIYDALNAMGATTAAKDFWAEAS